jgi:hypothetical protein
MWRSVLTVVIVAGVLAGCSLGGGGQQSGSLSGVVAMEGGKTDFSPLPGVNVRVIGGDVSRHLTSDRYGRFHTRLPAGRYVVTAVFAWGGTGSDPRESVVVSAGRPARVKLIELVA